MKGFVFALTALAFGLAGSAAYAQQMQSPETQGAQKTQKMQGAQTAPDTQTFVKKASTANQFEIESSQAALKKSQNDSVKQFAQQMVDDHTKIGQDMKKVLQQANLQAPSPTLDQEHQQKIDKLQNASGAEFNKLYKQMQTQGHQQAVQLFTSYSQNGDNAQLREFASATLPMLKQHLQEIEGLSLPQTSS
jgi:putative membrane protein